jgi:hypothetical protein
MTARVVESVALLGEPKSTEYNRREPRKRMRDGSILEYERVFGRRRYPGKVGSRRTVRYRWSKVVKGKTKGRVDETKLKGKS